MRLVSSLIWKQFTGAQINFALISIDYSLIPWIIGNLYIFWQFIAKSVKYWAIFFGYLIKFFIFNLIIFNTNELGWNFQIITSLFIGRFIGEPWTPPLFPHTFHIREVRRKYLVSRKIYLRRSTCISRYDNGDESQGETSWELPWHEKSRGDFPWLL